MRGPGVMMENDDVRQSAETDGVPQAVYRPRPSFGWLWTIALGLVILVSTVPAALASDEVPSGIRLIMLALALLGGAFFVTAAYFPTMRYTLEPDALVLTYGPLLRYRIPYADIDDVRTRDLVISLWSSARVPGLALWKVPYTDVGNVFMCSTRAARGVLLIRARGTLYGISPAEQDAFVDALLDRVRSFVTEV